MREISFTQNLLFHVPFNYTVTESWPKVFTYVSQFSSMYIRMFEESILLEFAQFMITDQEVRLSAEEFWSHSVASTNPAVDKKA